MPVEALWIDPKISCVALTSDVSTVVCAAQVEPPCLMSNRISDCPPLLEPGEWVRSVSELREMCVAKFPLSTTRWAIMDGFRKIVAMLEQESIPCEILVDGSFLTEEIEPDDIDFAIVVAPEFYDQCKDEQRKLLDWIGDNKDIPVTCPRESLPIRTGVLS
jgi:hypothetical protein